MKKLLSFILILTLAISCVSMVTFTVSAATYGDLTYTVSNGEVTITNCNTSVSGALEIPATIEGYPVKSIGDWAFCDCSSLTRITIPDSVTSIGDGAFSYCSALTSVTIPDGVTSIGGHAFEGCSSLTSVTIPNSVTSIYYQTFFGCSSLTSITIPDSVTSIGYQAFAGCSSLTSITVDKNNEKYYSVDNCLIEKGTNTLILGCKNSVIPDSVTSIYDSAFSGCSGLTSITIPDNVTSIGEWAFSWCNSLTSITIPDSVTSIGYGAFESCSSLTSITIGNSVTSIGSSAFAGCSSLTSVTIGNSVTSIGAAAFSRCSGLTSIIIPDSVTSIDDDAFYNCSSLTSITIPDSVTSIGDKAFYGCSSLTSITIPDSVTSIGRFAFEGCSKLNTVYYTGTQAQWDSISIEGDSNSYLINATRYYNSCIQRVEHTFDNVCDTECNVCQFVRTITHTYDNTCDTECNICKFIRTITHTYDNACDAECNICKDIRTVPEHSYTLNNNHTCDICKYSKAPEKPIVESKTNSSVTLVKLEGFEYSKDGITWQNSNIFANLSPDTTYTFYQRVKASSTALVSEISESVSVTFKSAQNTPSAPVVLSFTDTSVTLMNLTDGEYSLDGITWQDSNVFSNLLSGTEYTFYQRYKETETHEASNVSASITFKTEKAKQMLVPDAPTAKSFTANSITLNIVSGCEYSLDGKTWQASNVFNGLACGTEYTFYQRYAESETHYVGKSSSGATLKTDKGTQTAPNTPTLLNKTHNTITLNKFDGYEYSMDTVSWQESNVFTDLDPETNYIFYQRKAESDKYYASSLSASLIVKTLEPQGTITGATVDVGSTLTINYFAEAPEDAIMKFTSSSGRITEVNGVLDEKTGYYKFAYTGINPQCMGDTIKAELMWGDYVLDTKESYSVKTYCENQISKSASELGLTDKQYKALQTLLADMLVYGSEAQKYKDYNVSELPDVSEWISECKSTFKTPDGVKKVTGNADAENKVKSVGLNMANVNRIYFKLILNDENVVIKLNNEVIDRAELIKNADGTFTLYSSDIKATGFNDVHTLTLTQGEEVISTVQYNVNAYVKSKNTDATIGNIVKALSNYGNSATAYANSFKTMGDSSFELEDDIL